MRILASGVGLLSASVSCRLSSMASPQTIYDFSCTSIDGEAVPMEKYRGRTVLIVNVASK